MTCRVFAKRLTFAPMPTTPRTTRARRETALTPQQIPAFAGATDAVNADLTAHARTLRLKKGNIFVHEGAPLTGIFCVLSGLAKLFKSIDSGQEYITDLAQPGDIIGIATIFFGGAYDTHCEMIRDGTVLFIPQDDLLRVLKSQPKIAYTTMIYLASQLQQADEERFDLAVGSVRERAARLMLVLAQRLGHSDGQVIDVRVQLTRADLAEMIGTAPETLVRVLREFKRDRLIETRGHNIRILNVAKLANISLLATS